MPDGIFNRRADVWRPLLAIADVVGGSWPDRARQAAVALENSGDGAAESIGVQLLRDCRDVFERLGQDKIPSTMLAENLHRMEGRPWPEYGRSRKPITPTQIARLLRPYGPTPGTIRVGDETPKGYRLEAFKLAFARYLPSRAATPPQPAATNGSSEFQAATSEGNVAAQNPPKAAVSNTCGGVAAENGGNGDEGACEVEI